MIIRNTAAVASWGALAAALAACSAAGSSDGRSAGSGDVDMDTDGDSDTDTGTDEQSDDPAWNEPGNAPPEPDQGEDAGLDDNCDTEGPITYALSADDSNSMASPVIVRSRIRFGERVDPRKVRVHEFLNYYTFGYAPAEPGRVRIAAELRENPDVADGFDLQIAVRSADTTAKTRRPFNITLSVDTSGSMAGEPLALARECCLALAGSLAAGDVVAIVTWSTSSNLLLAAHEVDGPDDPSVIAACGDFEAAGATDLQNGLEAAFEQAASFRGPDRVNRVVLISDGRANAGVADAALIAKNAVEAEDRAIYLMGVGVGDAATYHDALFNVVTDAGKGAYVFVDTAAEAQSAFGARLLSNIEVAALDVRVALTLPQGFKIAAYHGEDYSVNPSEVEPQHLAANDAMIFHQVVSSCVASGVVPSKSDVLVRVDYRDPLTLASRQETAAYTLAALLEADAGRLAKGNAVVAYAEALKRLAALDGAAALELIDRVRADVGQAKTETGGDPELDEIDALLAAYRAQFE